MSTTTVDPGHPGLWWQDGPVPDECPDVRAKYDEQFAKAPKQRVFIPSHDQIIARGGSRG